MTAEDAAVMEEAHRLHAANGHPPGYKGPCWGPTLAEIARARRTVRLRKAEAPVIPPSREPVSAGALTVRHRHDCVTGCGTRYDCQQRCDPDHLDDSLCPDCFKKACRFVGEESIV